MVIAMLYTSIGIGIGYVSLEANIIGYWILGAFLGIVLTLHIKAHTYSAQNTSKLNTIFRHLAYMAG